MADQSIAELLVDARDIAAAEQILMKLGWSAQEAATLAALHFGKDAGDLRDHTGAPVPFRDYETELRKRGIEVA